MTQLVQRNELAQAIEQALVMGDLEKLRPEERLEYYRRVCDSIGVNPLTKPFDYIRLNNKLTLYATKACTDQLRTLRGVSVSIVSRDVLEGVYVVTARATDPSGRSDESTGAVDIAKLTGEARANALMKAETKAKRRVTLSLCGLGMLDESEVDSIPNAQRVQEQPAAEPRQTGLKALKAKLAPAVVDQPAATSEPAADAQEPQQLPWATPAEWVAALRETLAADGWEADAIDYALTRIAEWRKVERVEAVPSDLWVAHIQQAKDGKYNKWRDQWKAQRKAEADARRTKAEAEAQKSAAIMDPLTRQPLKESDILF